MPPLTANASSTASTETTVLKPASLAMAHATPVPSPMPSSPPRVPMVNASVRNWVRMLNRVAPSALRTPISRIRSVTETSMMFMTPMPPTTRLTLATPPSRTAKIAMDCCCASTNCWGFMIMKSFAPPGRILCSRRITRSMSTMPVSSGMPSATLADSRSRRSLPNTRNSAVDSGMNTSSSGFW